MNNLLLGAGAIGLFTTAIHTIAGQLNPVRPMLQSQLADDVKGCLLACWHMVTAFLLLSSAVFVYASISPQPQLAPLLNAIAIFYVLFAVIFIVVGGYFFGYRVFYKLPQWTLLMPIGILGLLGTGQI